MDTSNQYVSAAYAQQSDRQEDENSWGTGKILSGIGMMVGSVVWFVVGLFMGIIFFYPPFLFIFGVIALITGIVQKLNR